MRLTRLLLLATLLAAPFGAHPQGQRTLSVAVAANLKPAFEELATRFQAKNPGVKVRATYGASGSFFAQLSNGAPFDLFLSADADFPAKVVERGLADGAAFTYAYGKLVVWVAKGSTLDLAAKGLAALADSSVKKIAIANPETAPYGRAAKAALKNAGLYDKLEDRIVEGQSASQAAQFVQSGNAQAGFVPLSLAMTPPLSDEGRFWLLPPVTHPRIEQAGVVLEGAKELALAQAFKAFLISDAAREVLERLGYDLPAR